MFLDFTRKRRKMGQNKVRKAKGGKKENARKERLCMGGAWGRKKGGKHFYC